MLQFRIDAGDHKLKDHRETCAGMQHTYPNPKLVRMTSSSALKDYIQDAIISKMKAQSQGPLYTVKADEVTNISNWEQLSRHSLFERCSTSREIGGVCSMREHHRGSNLQ